MRNIRDIPTVAYMVRHFVKTNLSDPVSASDRGTARYTQYFSGDNTVGQINYLEFAPVSSDSFLRVYLYNSGTGNWDLKTETTHYTRSASGQTITWVATPGTGNDNIKVIYDHIKGWVYDDLPNFSSHHFPRISVVEADTNVSGKFLGIYQNIAAGVGDYNEGVFVISIFSKDGMKLTIDNREYKNEEVVRYLADKLRMKFHTNRVPPYWKFYDWKVTRFTPVHEFQDLGVFRFDMTVEVKYWANSVT